MENQQAEIRPSNTGIQIGGVINSPEMETTVVRMYRLLSSENLNASGEFQRGKVRCKWSYTHEDGVMKLDFTNPGKIEKEPRFNYMDPMRVHVHAVKTDNQTYWVTACGKQVSASWHRTDFVAVTCPECTKAITGS